MPPPYSVVFFGTPEFAVPSLEALINDPAFDVKLVITQPDKPVGRKKTLTSPPVKVIAEKYKLKVFQPNDVNHALRRAQGDTDVMVSSTNHDIIKMKADFFVVVAYGKILSEELLNIPKIMAVNVHASILPRWRGASPIHHAILTGDRETGVTVQRMIRALDKGPILGQRRIPLDTRATFQNVHDRLKTLGAHLLAETLKNPLVPIDQDESKVTVCKKLSRADGVVDPHVHSSADIDVKVRAFNPWPGVMCMIHGIPIKILETRLDTVSDAYPLRCADGTIVYLVRVQEAGKKIMSGSEWARGKKIPQES